MAVGEREQPLDVGSGSEAPPIQHACLLMAGKCCLLLIRERQSWATANGLGEAGEK